MLKDSHQILDKITKEFNEKNNKSWNNDLLYICIKNYENYFYNQYYKNKNQQDVALYESNLKQQLLSETKDHINYLFYTFISSELDELFNKIFAKSKSHSDEEQKFFQNLYCNLNQTKMLFQIKQQEIADLINNQGDINKISNQVQQLMFAYQTIQEPSFQQVQFNALQQSYKEVEIDSSQHKIISSAFEKGNFKVNYQEQITNDIKSFKQNNKNIILEIHQNFQDDKTFYLFVNDQQRPQFGSLTILVSSEQLKAVDFLYINEENHNLNLTNPRPNLINLFKSWWIFEFEMHKNEDKKQISAAPSASDQAQNAQYQTQLDFTTHKVVNLQLNQPTANFYQNVNQILNSAFEKGNFLPVFQDQIKNDIKQFMQVKQNIILEIIENTLDDKTFYILVNDQKRPNFGQLRILVTSEKYKLVDFLFINKFQTQNQVNTNNKLIDLIKVWWKLEQDMQNFYSGFGQAQNVFLQTQLDFASPVQANNVLQQAQLDLATYVQPNMQINQSNSNLNQQITINYDFVLSDQVNKIINSAFEKGNFLPVFQEQIKKDIKFMQAQKNFILEIIENTLDDKTFFILINDQKKPDFGQLRILVTSEKYKLVDFLYIEKGNHILQQVNVNQKLIDLIKLWWKFEYVQTIEDEKCHTAPSVSNESISNLNQIKQDVQDVEMLSDQANKIINSAFEKGNFLPMLQEQIKKEIKQFMQTNKYIILKIIENTYDDKTFFIIAKYLKRPDYGCLEILVTTEKYKLFNFLNIQQGKHILKQVNVNLELIDLINLWWKFEFGIYEYQNLK